MSLQLPLSLREGWGEVASNFHYFYNSFLILLVMKSFLTWTPFVLLTLYTLFIIIAPPIVEKQKNLVSSPPPYSVSAEAQALYDQLDFVGDLHCDALLWDRQLHKKYDYGHVDFPRMQESNVAFQAFTIVTKSPQGQNFNQNSGESMDMITPLVIGQGQRPSTWFSLVNRATYQCMKLKKYAKKSGNECIVITSKADFQTLLEKRKVDRNIIGGMLGVEGAHCLEGDIENVEEIYTAGVRMMGPAHFFDNEVGGSAHGIEKGGLSPFGFEVLKKMQENNMIMDIAHSSEAVIQDIFANYTGPILTSHTGVDATYPSLRNLSDKELRQLADRDGLVGIAFFPGAVGDGGVPAIIRAMKHVKDLIGVDYVALGSDFDGSVQTPFDVTGLPLLVEEMLKQGFTHAEIEAVMGGNLKRFLLKYLP